MRRPSLTLHQALRPCELLLPPVTLPILLLGLYLGLLAVSVGICSWAGHMTPAPDEARRVTDAAERAAIGHLAMPARLGGIAALLLAVLSSTLAITKQLPTTWFMLAPLFAPALVGAALFYCARKLLKASGQLVGTDGSDAKLVLSSRISVGASLCCDATVGLVILGLYSLSVKEMPAEQARFLVFLTGSSIALSAVIFARAAASAHLAATQGARGDRSAPHPGSLALLVSSSFHAPLGRLLGLIVLSTLGHCALLGTVPVGEESAESFWLYPHLLKLLGLFGLLFAGLLARTSEDESSGEGWLRGALVYLVLMIAGAWSLSSELPVGWSRMVPAGLSFLYVALGLSVWVAKTERANSPGLALSALSKMPATVLFVGLMVLLSLSTALTEEQNALPSQALLSLLLAGTLSAAPLSFVWLIGEDLLKSTNQTRQLAYVEPVRFVQERTANRGTLPSTKLFVVLPLLALVISVSALSTGLLSEGAVSGLMLALLSVGGALGAIVLGALSGQLERACEKPTTNIVALLDHHQASPEEEGLNFEDAVIACRDAISRSAPSWLLLCLAPTASLVVAALLVPPELFQALAFGVGLGAALLGVGLELLLNSSSEAGRRALASLSLVACLAQTLWLLTAGSFPS